MALRNLVILFLLLALGIAGYFLFKPKSGLEPGEACTMDALVCPDGSSVGRVPPNCEFAPCPGAPDDEAADATPERMGEGSTSLYKDMIRIESPLPESTIGSPLVIKGEARGSWFFEGSFPVVLVDWDGRIIAEAQAKAQGEWMTSEYVPFTAEINFAADTSVSNRGALILRKDNPSGLPQNDDAFEYTVFFKK